MEQKTLIFKLLFIGFFCFVLSTNVQSQKLIKGKAKVIDGDTIHIGNNKIPVIDIFTNRSHASYIYNLLVDGTKNLDF